MAIESVGGSVISKITELSVEPAIRQFRYMFCFNNFLQEFNEQKQNLTLALDRLQNAAKVAERNSEEIEKDVNKWLEDANKEIEDVKRFEDEIGKNGKCFTWCPYWMRQYKLSKALAKKKETFSKLEEKSKNFPTLSHKAPLPDIEFLPRKDFTPSESSKEAFKQIMEALKGNNINMIGLYGMGGVGKTTLVKEAGRRVKELQLFDQVLMVAVSQHPNVTNIQYQMADSLGLKFEQRSTEGRAKQVWQRLQKEKKMLIILDDVWKYIDLREIGIAYGDDHMGCKILLTTLLQTVCSSMKCQPKVFLRELSQNEAWALFKTKAGLRDDNSALNKVAKEVARECKGLPIALVTVGRALRDQPKFQWEAAYKQLKNSQLLMEQVDEQENAYACLKLSYDYLKLKETKLCFLLCCLFPEDYDIPIEDLTRYGVVCGLHRDAESIEDARKQVCVAVKNLKDCCMLLGTEIEERVKMHDLVRDVAIQIASSSNEFDFVLKTGTGLKEWPGSFESFEDCTTISLMGNRLTELREGLVCPQLKVLLLELKDSLDVPSKFFEGMKALEVLSLNGGCLSLESLECSTNLQSLQFIECECKDPISLGKLLRLKILGFLGCSSIEELPEEIGELENLRLLDLTDCMNLRRIPVNLIGRLKKLEELLIGDDSFKKWGVGGTSRGGMNASLTELNSLSHLSVLSLSIPEIKYIPRDFFFPKLLKYEIVLGVKSYLGFPWFLKMIGSYQTCRRLTFHSISATSLNAKTFEHLLPGVSQLDLRYVEGLKNIIWSPDQMTTHEQQQRFLRQLECVEVSNCRDMCTLFPAKLWRPLKNLRRVRIFNCQALKEVFELGEVAEVSDEEKVLLLSSLTELVLGYLHKLKCIWKGPTRHVSLQGLIHLKLDSLFELKFIFTPSLAQCLPQLETLVIYNCSELEHIITSKDDNYEGEIIPVSICFPKLKTLSMGCCWELEYVFPVSAAPSLLNLEAIQIQGASKLKQIFGSGEGEDVPTTDGDGIIVFPQLRKLELSRSGSNLNFFGSKNFAAELPSLQDLQIIGHNQLGNLLAKLLGLTNLRSLSIEDCEGVEEVMQVRSFVTNRRDGHELSLLSLETLKLSSLPDLRSICKGLMLKNLTTLEVVNCNGLRHILPSSMIASLLQLKVLTISRCEELEEIIAKDDDDKDQILSETRLQSLCFPSLCDIEVSQCNKLKSLFPVIIAAGLPQLTNLEVREAPQLTEVFGQDDKASRLNVNVVPILRGLSLKNLPSIVCFSLGSKNFLFPRLEACVVGNCPKMATQFTVAPDGSMSAQSEVSQVVEASSSSCAMPSSTYKMWTRDGGWEEQDFDPGSFCLPVGIFRQFLAALLPLGWIHPVPVSKPIVEKERKPGMSKKTQKNIKGYRDTTLNGAVEQMYTEMGSRHRVRSSSYLEIRERICAVFIPIVGIIEAVVLSFTACFDHHPPSKKFQYTINDLRRIVSNSLFPVNKVKALLGLLKKFSSFVVDDGLIHKEELKLALLKNLQQVKTSSCIRALHGSVTVPSNGFLEKGGTATLLLFLTVYNYFSDLCFALMLYTTKRLL
ncbi:unnamed protein product [Dovyalis caffra]|uniref:AAA+ ATPase domain-containing protein n=1 Tax=Dovyalis caffra TaxID=77055 RepID=A0AAV1RSL2_9ROSI|nr:unnamed protein product [Dovyalis caffra]